MHMRLRSNYENSSGKDNAGGIIYDQHILLVVEVEVEAEGRRSSLMKLVVHDVRTYLLWHSHDAKQL